MLPFQAGATSSNWGALSTERPQEPAASPSSREPFKFSADGEVSITIADGIRLAADVRRVLQYMPKRRQREVSEDGNVAARWCQAAIELKEDLQKMLASPKDLEYEPSYGGACAHHLYELFLAFEELRMQRGGDWSSSFEKALEAANRAHETHVLRAATRSARVEPSAPPESLDRPLTPTAPLMSLTRPPGAESMRNEPFWSAREWLSRNNGAGPSSRSSFTRPGGPSSDGRDPRP